MKIFNCLLPRTGVSPSVVDDDGFDNDIKITPNRRHAVKILLLGAGESGKTTIIQQMKIMHIQDYTLQERQEKAKIIRNNLHESIYEITKNVSALNLNFDSEGNQKLAEILLKMNHSSPDKFTMEYADLVESLFLDGGVKESYRRSNEYQLMDNAIYFLNRVRTICSLNYVPTNDDILRCRNTTTGIQEIRFHVKVPNKSFYHEIRLFDVGGQREIRKKWIQTFEGIESVLFLISVSDFDQRLREDESTNRLEEALYLFKRVWNNGFLLSAGLICFLNKQDILEEKIRAGKSIGDYFPEYKNVRMSTTSKEISVIDECLKTRCFIRQKLMDITKNVPKKIVNVESFKKEVFYHFTVATDSNNIRKVFSDVHNMVLNKYMNENGLY